MSVQVDDRKWRDYQRKVLRDRVLRIVTPLPYAKAASEAAQSAADALRADTTDADALGARLLEGVKVRCPVDTGALRESLALEGDEDA